MSLARYPVDETEYPDSELSCATLIPIPWIRTLLQELSNLLNLYEARVIKLVQIKFMDTDA